MSTAEPTRTLRLYVDGDALAKNWQQLDRMSGSARAGAAVKANCYGLGIDACVPVLREIGCEQFFVAHWSEVADVADYVPTQMISVLHGPLSDDDCNYARETGAVPVINSLDQARRWNSWSGGPCDLMVDTGINRLGISLDEIGDPAIQALNVRNLMSHLASADEESSLNALQLSRFESILGQVEHQAASLANSAGIGLGRDYAFDLTRPGLALYGGVPRPEMAPDLKQVAFLGAAVIQCRELSPGDSVGYNATFTADRAMKVATVSLGYADGFLRSWAGSAGFEMGEASLKVLGKISMDMVVLDCSECPDIKEGDWVDVPYSLPDAAQQSGLSQYELLTVLGQRLAC